MSVVLKCFPMSSPLCSKLFPTHKSIDISHLNECGVSYYYTIISHSETIPILNNIDKKLVSNIKTVLGCENWIEIWKEKSKR